MVSTLQLFFKFIFSAAKTTVDRGDGTGLGKGKCKTNFALHTLKNGTSQTNCQYFSCLLYT